MIARPQKTRRNSRSVLTTAVAMLGVAALIVVGSPTVGAEPVAIGDIDDQVWLIGDEVEIEIEPSDPTAEFSAEGLPSGVEISTDEEGNGLISGSPTEAGEFEVTVTETVGEDETSETFAVLVPFLEPSFEVEADLSDKAPGDEFEVVLIFGPPAGDDATDDTNEEDGDDEMDAVGFTAADAVAVSASAIDTLPTGSVEIDGVTTPLVDGRATITIQSETELGEHVVNGTYSGDAIYAPGDFFVGYTVIEIIEEAPTTTAPPAPAPGAAGTAPRPVSFVG